MRFLIAFALFLGATISPASACSCIWPDNMTVEKHLEKTDVVFRGIFLVAEPVEVEKYWFPNREGKFEVLEVLKGEISDSVLVYYSESNGVNCGLNFEIGIEYEVFAGIDDAGRIVTNHCAGTQRALDWSWDEYRQAAKKQ